MNNKQIYKISVAIPAYNEGQNIANVVRYVLQQKETGWLLNEILIYSDGSSDNTISVLREIKSKKLKVIDGKKRKGKTFRINQMLKDFSGDILFMFDADIKFDDKQVISKMVREFAKDKSVMLVGGNSMPLSPKTFFQKAVYTTFRVFYDSRKTFRDGHNVFGCTGSCIALHKSFAKKLVLPNIINEDVYIYLACKNAGYTFRYIDSARVLYKLPNNIKDYIKQVLRNEPKAVHYDLASHFQSIIHQELDRPILPYAKSVFKAFLTNPPGTLLMIFLNVLCMPLFSFVHKKYSLSWFTAESTKNI